jgi:hypothetical protein
MFRFTRHEIIRYVFCAFLDSIELLLSHTYVCITFVIMYGSMWSFDMHFDTRFFAVAFCMLTYLEFSLFFFGSGIRNLVNYLAAAKRIQVCFHTLMNYSVDIKRIFFYRDFFCLMNLKEIVGYYLREMNPNTMGIYQHTK